MPSPFSGGADAGIPDAYSALVEYQLTIERCLDFDYAGLALTVDGVPSPADDGDVVERTFPSYQAAKDSSFTAETWYEDSPLFRLAVSPGVCEDAMHSNGEIATPRSERVRFCLEPSGELRLASYDCDFPWGWVTGDGFCTASCYPFPGSWPECYGDNACGLVVALEEPLYGYFDCVPAGQIPLGGSCVRGETGYDDCALGGVCMDGTCRELCADNHPCSDNASCDLLPHLREPIGICASNGG